MTTVSKIVRRIPKKLVAGFVIPAAGAAVTIGPPRIAFLAAFVVIVSALVVLGVLVADSTRVTPAAGGYRRSKAVQRLEDRLWNGFSASAVHQLRELSSDPSINPFVRSQALSTLAEWHSMNGRDQAAYESAFTARLIDPDSVRRELLTLRPPRKSTRHFDVIIVSNLNLPGGSTSSNIQEITAQSRAGLTTGLVHHPVYDWNVAKPVNRKILDLVDGDQVRFVGPHERVTCDVLMVRVPKIGEKIMDDLPEVDAGAKAVIINQTPRRDYSPKGHGEAVWDVRSVASGFRNWLGDHAWYPIGPSVRSALVDHHADELDGVRLADIDWLNIIDVDAWQREGRRVPDGRYRIGRHSRDFPGKWPETGALLEAAYPLDDPFEVHVLGGASVAMKRLRRKPQNWTIHEFDTISVRDFLHGLDVYVYFTTTDYVEAFGRAPLEALATGLPTILPIQFKDLFGDAAMYGDPADVRTTVEVLMADRQRYDWHASHGLEVTRQRFGYEAHLNRLADLGSTGG